VRQVRSDAQAAPAGRRDDGAGAPAGRRDDGAGALAGRRDDGTGVKVVRLGRPLERALAEGHPWIYAEALEEAAHPSGTIVDVLDGEGRFVARGLFDPASPIRVRVWTLDARQPVDAALVRARLGDALRLRQGGAVPRGTDCFRWANGEGDRLPGVVVDVYGPVAVVRFDGEGVQALRPVVAAAVAELGASVGVRHVYERSRGARGAVLFGGEPPRPVPVIEHGARFLVDVHAGQKTGFFLDQRDNRRLLRDYAAGRDVANLFAYTGGFSVQCALGGARQVTSVDSARQAMEDAQRNFAANGLDPSAHRFDVVDAWDWLREAQSAGRTYDLVVVDPPSFAPSERALKAALGAYRDLNVAALATVARGGLLASASCSSHVSMEAFVDMLRDAGRLARRSLRLLEVRGQPADHPSLPAFAEGRYLKFLLAAVD
jgi:23S rRNA (cytosine1962-C5)-methyltransferase